MELKQRVQKLATLESQYPHILSVYLHCRDGGRDRVVLFDGHLASTDSGETSILAYPAT